jgi:hypothetical protein
VGEGLRVVPEELAGRGVGLLGVQAERPGEALQLFDEPDGLVDGAGGGEGLGEPEGAR